tara:strand:- start:384 stop:743 length:360 start_codon:yes stop_codon:yes gene_type:complete
MTNNINLTDNSCPICFNEISFNNKYITNCKHEYCKDCLDNWFDKGKNTCPNCRTVVKYLNNDNIKIRLININKEIVIQSPNIPENSIIIKKSLIRCLLSGYILIFISIGYNIYLINNDL